MGFGYLRRGRPRRGRGDREGVLGRRRRRCVLRRREHRLAAVVADPARWGIVDGMRGLVTAIGSPELATGLPDLLDAAAARMIEIIKGDRGFTWRVIKRGFWVPGSPTCRG